MKGFVRRALVLVLALGAAILEADVSLPRILGDNMVLQRGVGIAIWGRAAVGEPVNVRFAGQERQAAAGLDGRWAVKLGPLEATAAPQDMTIVGANVIVRRNILVGEVWLCSGQSILEYAVGVAKAWAPPAAETDPELARELTAGPLPSVRLFRVEKKRAAPEIVSSGWQEADGEARNEFSALGYYFARQLHHELDVPVGVIQAAWGGSRIEEWTPAEAYAKLATVLRGEAAASLEQDPAWVGRNFEAMVHPLAPYSLRGVLRYQGGIQPDRLQRRPTLGGQAGDVDRRLAHRLEPA
jgi:sialate O-acetylesterase